jgi:putative glutamine amidotransferase
MRTARAEAVGEERDALASDWTRFMGAALPDCLWLPIPNLGPAAAAFFRGWGLDALILTGGDDLGAAPRRDATESALLRHALEAGVPVFGVCRGLQMIQHFLGGVVRPCPREAHVAVRHALILEPGAAAGGARSVNSFHGHGVLPHELAAGLIPFATAPDGWVEGLMHREASITAVQWHPERESVADPHDVSLIRRTFGLEPFPAPPAACPAALPASSLLTPFTFPPCVP